MSETPMQHLEKCYMTLLMNKDSVKKILAKIEELSSFLKRPSTRENWTPERANYEKYLIGRILELNNKIAHKGKILSEALFM